MSKNTQDKISSGRLPDFIVIGAMKCGTTSLHNYLNFHPDISMSHPKEPNFFVERKNWDRGLQWYQSNFKNRAAKLTGESSTNYTKAPTFPGVPEKMRSIIPNAKLIYLVRDPIERIVSHYYHALNDGLESRDFEAALTNLEGNHYLNCSRYFFQLRLFLDYYPASQISIICAEELLLNRQDTLRKVFEFLGADTGFTDERFMTVFSVSAEKEKRAPLRPCLRQALEENLREDVLALRRFTGQAFDRWSI